ncbi:MAG: hypothetical protein A2663_00665 [Candidatus Buchananbacteria bacterium RIFCSPHIGHO2_01_FULL_46_12]|uniref:Uncharacterized protein n=1 Tax=Candidatus Buchananbacteria bacterium RIFCSPHIGHO2_01_FULL_46_12 TaxID=1797536 RepID=A0A1G1Y6S4_9BACT|nr:MAG: hypothetical protein A2663_00665 [Candidatus Buchananbacteria bacterium RIFCSPHIGHO2_01_FULL_46_12]
MLKGRKGFRGTTLVPAYARFPSSLFGSFGGQVSELRQAWSFLLILIKKDRFQALFLSLTLGATRLILWLRRMPDGH